MAISSILGLVGGVVGAGGSIAGGILGNKGATGESGVDVSDTIGSTPGIAQDPLVMALTLRSLASLGVPLDPFTLNQMSPMRRAIAALDRLPGPIGDRQRIANVIRESLEFSIDRNLPAAVYPGDTREFAQDARSTLSQVGINIDDLLVQEREFRATFGETIAAAEERAGFNKEAQDALQDQLNQLALDFPAATGDELDDLRGQEQARLDRFFDERQLDLERSAQFGGFNPGRSLGDLEDIRKESPLQALQNANALLAARQGLVGQNFGLLATMRGVPEAQAANLAGLRTSGQPSIVGAAQANAGTGGNTLASGVAGGSNILGSLLPLLSPPGGGGGIGGIGGGSGLFGTGSTAPAT